MIYVHWIVLVAYTVIAIVAMITVLLEHRQPAKTIAWVLVLSFLPLVGIVLYFFFGGKGKTKKLNKQKKFPSFLNSDELQVTNDK